MPNKWLCQVCRTEINVDASALCPPCLEKVKDCMAEDTRMELRTGVMITRRHHREIEENGGVVPEDLAEFKAAHEAVTAILDAAANLALEQKKAEDTERQIKSAVSRSEIPLRFQSPVEISAEPAKRWVDGQSTGLYLHGPVGTGKTHGACTLAMARFKKHVVPGASYWDGDWKEVFFASLPDILRKIRAGFGSNDGGESKILNTAINAGILVLDDVASEKQTEWSVQQLYLIVNERYSRNRPTIYTSNLALSRLGKFLAADGDALSGLRIADRIFEQCEQIKLDGKSRRRQAIGEHAEPEPPPPDPSTYKFIPFA